MQASFVKCKCLKEFNEVNFYIHIKTCSEFLQHFHNFDLELIKLLDYYGEPDNLIINKVFLIFCLTIIHSKIKNGAISMPKSKTIDVDELLNKVINCTFCCQSNDIKYLNCAHPICTECYVKLAKNNFFHMKCPKCNTEISNNHKKQLLGDEVY